MSKLKTFFRLLFHPNRLLYVIVCKFPWLIKDDKKYIQYLWKNKMNYPLNLDNPKTYNEKLQWLKLYNHKPEYTIMVDKYLAKEYVANKIGKEHIIPTIGVWDNVDDIDFDSLPQQFVLKCTHDSGGLVICKDKANLNIFKAKNKLNKSLNTNFYLLGREWPYKDVRPRIIAEKFMVDESGYELKDYKFLCFDGEPKILYIATDRYNPNKETKFDFYDLEFNHLPFKLGHPNSRKQIQKPFGFDDMLKYARVLSAGIPHVRVDFYEVNKMIYFGELTFYQDCGFVSFDPQEWDYKLGEMIKLPVKL